jgi:hypothetical protein
MLPTNEDIRKLHTTYCQETGLQIALPVSRHILWEAFLARGFTTNDLTLVCRSLRRQISNGDRRMACLRFTTLIGDVDNFEELLAEFRALQRKPTYAPGKAQVLRATGRESEPKQSDAQKAQTLLERTQLAERLREWKKQL